MDTEELKEIFRDCPTAMSIIKDQIGDVDGTATWYPWDTSAHREATLESVVQEVTDAWDAAGGLKTVGVGDLVGLYLAVKAENIEPSPRMKEYRHVADEAWAIIEEEIW